MDLLHVLGIVWLPQLPKPVAGAEIPADGADAGDATTETDTGPADTVAEPPPEDNGFLGWFALLLAALGQEPEPAEPATTTAETTPVETVAPEPAGSESDMPWGWIALGLALLGGGAAGGIIIWRRRRARGPS